VPCVRCSARQTDPARGASAWKRGVQGGQQVLVCPDCQRDGTWVSEMDSCPRCGSTQLVRRLGETVCRSCGEVVAAEPASAAPQGGGAPGLSDDVSAALDRVLGRSTE
jgi:predicted amidophosphoribosyltransferase